VVTLDKDLFDWGFIASKTFDDTVIKSLKNIKEAQNLLDIGCGKKQHKGFLQCLINFDNYFGLDLKQSNPDIIGTGELLPFRENSLDFVACFQVLEHVEEPQSVINEIHRVLKANCIGIVSVPFARNVHVTKPDYLDYWRFTNYGLEKIFSKFNSVKIYPTNGHLSTIFQLLNDSLHSFPLRGLEKIKIPFFILNNITGLFTEKIFMKIISRLLHHSQESIEEAYNTLPLNYIIVAKK
jgi:SAM-dependent methyltransferase